MKTIATTPWLARGPKHKTRVVVRAVQAARGFEFTVFTEEQEFLPGTTDLNADSGESTYTDGQLFSCGYATPTLAKERTLNQSLSTMMERWRVMSRSRMPLI